MNLTTPVAVGVAVVATIAFLWLMTTVPRWQCDTEIIVIDDSRRSTPKLEIMRGLGPPGEDMPAAATRSQRTEMNDMFADTVPYAMLWNPRVDCGSLEDPTRVMMDRERVLEDMW